MLLWLWQIDLNFEFNLKTQRQLFCYLFLMPKLYVQTMDKYPRDICLAGGIFVRLIQKMWYMLVIRQLFPSNPYKWFYFFKGKSSLAV